MLDRKTNSKTRYIAHAFPNYQSQCNLLRKRFSNPKRIYSPQTSERKAIEAKRNIDEYKVLLVLGGNAIDYRAYYTPDGEKDKCREVVSVGSDKLSIGIIAYRSISR
jgi:hypothetical protein